MQARPSGLGSAALRGYTYKHCRRHPGGPTSSSTQAGSWQARLGPRALESARRSRSGTRQRAVAPSSRPGRVTGAFRRPEASTSLPKKQPDTHPKNKHPTHRLRVACNAGLAHAPQSAPRDQACLKETAPRGGTTGGALVRSSTAFRPGDPERGAGANGSDQPPEA